MHTSTPLTTLTLLCYTACAVQLAINKNFPDPTVITVGGSWYAFASGSNNARIPGATSPDFIHWTVTPDGTKDHDYLASTPAWCYQPSAAVAARATPSTS